MSFNEMEYLLFALALVVIALGVWHLSLVEPMIDDALAKIITGRRTQER